MSNFLEDMRLFLLGFPNPVGLDREKTYRIFQNPTGLVQYLQRERERERESNIFPKSYLYLQHVFASYCGFFISCRTHGGIAKIIHH